MLKNWPSTALAKKKINKCFLHHTTASALRCAYFRQSLGTPAQKLGNDDPLLTKIHAFQAIRQLARKLFVNTRGIGDACVINAFSIAECRALPP
jgi:hypothetical protein